MFEDIKPIANTDKVAVFMETGKSYVTRLGIRFSEEHPYQLVDIEEITEILSLERFRIASADEIKKFYS
jgi:hypothetical protein